MFNNLLDCPKPQRNDLQRTPGCLDFSSVSNEFSEKVSNYKTWLLSRCFEMIFQKFSTLKDSLEYTQLSTTHIEMNQKGDQFENQDNNLLQLHQDEQ